MKRIATILISLVISAVCMAQNNTEGQNYETKDSLVFRQAASVDSTLVGKSIFNILNAHQSQDGDVKIHQSQAITDAMKKYISDNSSRKITGYRVRILFDNSQTARNTSENVMNSFKAAHPGVPAYRSYQNPFFKVMVGDFRTKSEALEFLQKVKPTYPSAIVVKENINYPAVDKAHNYVVDTVTVIRKLPQ